MTKLIRCYLAAMLLIACVSIAVSQQDTPSKKLNLPGADFRKAPGQLLFSPEHKLYVAYRTAESTKLASTIRIVIFDPMTGRQSNTHDYAVPPAPLPRVASNFGLSQDGTALAYAELHAPEILLTIDALTLNQMSMSDTNLFGDQDVAPHVSTITSQALLLSAGKLTCDGKVTAVHEIRKISLNPSDLRRVVLEKTIPAEEDVGEVRFWRKRISARQELGRIIPLNSGALGLTNMLKEGWLQVFDKTGKELASLHNPECGFVGASLSPDQQVGVAVCERTGSDEEQLGETLRRDAVVFEVETLKVIGTIPMSKLSVKERGPGRDDLWVAVPSPVVWHGKDSVLLAIPDFPDLINLYAIARPSPTTH